MTPLGEPSEPSRLCPVVSSDPRASRRRATTHHRRRPVLGNPGVSDPAVRGLALWRRAIACRWVVLAAILAVGAFPAAGPTHAQSGTEPSQDEPVGLLFHSADGAISSAPVLATDVQIQVTGMIVRARVTQRFANPGDEWQEGIYAFPLPEAAAVDGLRMTVGDRVVEGEIREKEEARQMYEQAKQEGAKASLVEQHRPNLFTTRVANIGPGEEVEVEIHYQQTLRWEEGLFRLRFPMTITPRFDPPPDAPQVPPAIVTTSLATLAAPAANRGPVPSGVRQALLRTGQAADRALGEVATAVSDLLDPRVPVNPVRLTVDLDAGVPLQTLDSAHHAIDVREVDPRRGRYEVTLDRRAVSADRDFELTWRPILGADPRTVLFTETLGLDTYALLMVLPPDPDASGFRRLPRETVFILDISGSMEGASIREAKRSLLFALDRLAPEDSFNILAFKDQTLALFPGSWPAEPEMVERARVWVTGLQAGGGTVMLPALLAALDGRPDGYGRGGARAVKQVVFMTDGAVGNEDELFSAIERHLGEARLFTVGIGSAPNSHFMSRAAELGRGTFTFIGQPDQVEERMEELFGKLESPALTDVEVRWDDPGAEMEPRWVPDLYAGEPVVVAARLGVVGSEVHLTGERDGSWWDETLPLAQVDVGGVDAGGVESGIGKLWARRKITSLSDDWRRAPKIAADGSPSIERAELRRQMVELALEHHLVSRFTSLVAVEVMPSRPAGAPLETRPIPNVRPAGATWDMPGYLPSGGTSARLSLWLGLALLALALALLRLFGSPVEEPVR